MNALDSLITTVAPRWGLSRVRARMAVAAYKAAQPSRTHKANRNRGDADSSVTKAGVSLREQARYLEQNYDTVDGLLTTLTNNVVGKDGIGIEPMPLDYKGNVHSDCAKTLLDAFSEWSLKCETSGDHTRPELERLACRTWLRDGEVLGEFVRGNVAGFKHPNGNIPFSIQAMEPDFLPMNDSLSNNVIQGIERNPWGQAINYHVYRVHPGDMSHFAIKTRPISADDMLHIKLVKRLHQGRGISILASSLERIGGIQNYEESELVAARIAAAMAFYIKKGMPENYDEDDKAETRRQISISPGTVFDDLKPGEDVGTIESNRPSALLPGFLETMGRFICSATGANFSTVFKKYDGTYSAQRQELVESYLSYGVLSNQFIAQWSRPIYRAWVQMALLSGDITLPADVDPRTVSLAFYQPPVMPWIDPKKEAEGNTAVVAGGFGTEAEVIRARGKNPNEVKKQRQREINENRDNGLVFTSDPFHQFYGAKHAENTDRTDQPTSGDSVNIND